MTTTETNGAQEHPGMEMPEPQKEHRWLQQLVGEWTFEGRAAMGPGMPETAFRGTERVRALGEVWFLAEGAMGEGEAARTIATLGFDPQRKRFVGTFIGSMMTHMWVYDGSLDADERVLTLDTEGPGMSGDGSMAKYRDVIELDGAGGRAMSSHIQGEDGSWTQFMRMTYTRISSPES